MSMDPQAHSESEKWCQAPLCKSTNWGGHNRLHMRSSDCPPYDPDPQPNDMADLWEGVREMARRNTTGIDGNQRWGAENSAVGAPVGIVLYDDDDDLFTVKERNGEWATYSHDHPGHYGPLTNADIDRDIGDQIVGRLNQGDAQCSSDH